MATLITMVFWRAGRVDQPIRSVWQIKYQAVNAPMLGKELSKYPCPMAKQMVASLADPEKETPTKSETSAIEAICQPGPGSSWHQ
jgi:hypothetical protein